jgi:hypothetical protein
MDPNELTIEQILAALEAQWLADLDRRLADAEKTLKATGALNKAKLTIRRPAMHNAEYIRIVTEKANLTKIRKALGCPLRKSSVEPLDYGNTVEVFLKPIDVPNMRIVYKEKVKENGRCRIQEETHVTRHLVCSRR